MCKENKLLWHSVWTDEIKVLRDKFTHNDKNDWNVNVMDKLWCNGLVFECDEIVTCLIPLLSACELIQMCLMRTVMLHQILWCLPVDLNSSLPSHLSIKTFRTVCWSYASHQLWSYLKSVCSVLWVYRVAHRAKTAQEECWTFV